MATRGELKHLSNPRKRKIIDFVSSGERTRISLNLNDVKLRSVVIRVLWGARSESANFRRKEVSFNVSRTVWKI